MNQVSRFFISFLFLVFSVGVHAEFASPPVEPEETVTVTADDVVDVYPDGSIYSHKLGKTITSPEESNSLMGPGAMILVGVGGGALGGGITALVTGGNAQQILLGTMFGGVAGGYFTMATMGGSGMAIVGTVIGVAFTAGGGWVLLKVVKPQLN